MAILIESFPTNYCIGMHIMSITSTLIFLSFRPPCAVLFKEAIKSSKMYYNNHHVYPYTYQGGYFYRNKMYKDALESWADAADVIRQ